STMQERLEDAMESIARHPDLVRVKPDTFGLHAYPPQPYPANGTQAHAQPVEGGAEAAEPKKGRRRRGRGGRPADAVEGAAEAPAEAAAEGDEEGAEAEEGEAPATGVAAAGEAGAPTGEKRRRRRRGGRGRRRRGEGGEAVEAKPEGAAPEVEEDEEAPPPIPEELPSEAAAAGTPGVGDEAVEAAGAAADEAELLDESAEEAGDEEELEEGEIDEHTGPLLAPAFGAEDVTRTDDDRTVRPEIRGSRDERHRRHKGGGRDRHRERGGNDRAAATGGERKPHAPAHEHKERAHEPRAHAAHEPRAHAVHEPRAHAVHEPRATEARTGDLLETLLELLRGAEGRPMHVRHLVDTAVKKRVLDDKAHPADLVRLARAALVREQREREAEGLRPRIRALGGGNYGTVDRKLDPELLQAERELGDRAARLRDATRAGVRRRLGRMTPAAFDALGRTLCDKLGITGLELLRRGEGVTYWGGTRPRGVAETRVLVAFRPGEGEVNRRAVGELRAGLAAKGYDEGLLFAAGRPNAEALAELKQGGVTLYDGVALAGLLVRHGLGVKRVSMPIDYLDLDFFFELQES
ncbi:MAG: restriction endonuclease, partial [Polyangia bacterium]